MLNALPPDARRTSRVSHALPRAAAVLLLLAVAATPGAAQVTVPFSAAATGTATGFVNGERVARAQLTGDFVQQTFTGAALPASVSTLTLDLRFMDLANNAVPFGFDVFLNAVSIGSVSFTTGGGTPTITTPTFRLLSSNTFNFGSIAAIAGGYTVRVVQTSASIPSGEGNLLVDLDGANASTVTFGARSVVPEPSTVALLGSALVMLGGVSVSRRRRGPAA